MYKTDSHAPSQSDFQRMNQLCLKGCLEEIKDCISSSSHNLNLLKHYPEPIAWAAKQNQEAVLAYLIDSGIVENEKFIKEAFEMALMYNCEQVIDYFCLKAPKHVIAIILSMIDEGSVFNSRWTKLQSSQRIKIYEPQMREILQIYTQKENLEKEIKSLNGKKNVFII